MLLGLSGLAQADKGDLGFTFDTAYVSKYMWNGFNFYGHDNGAIQPSMDVDLWGTGFGATFWASYALKSGSRDLEEFDYILYYSGQFLDDTAFATDYTVSWLYFDFYDAPTRALDLQELMAQFSWPELLPSGVVPSYTVGKLWPAKSGSAAIKHIGGWIHVLGLGYGVTMPGLTAEDPEQVISLLADLAYNDGFGAPGADHDWSHATFGASTSFSVAENLAFTPAVYYQMSMEDSVNPDDEVWATLSLTYGF